MDRSITNLTPFQYDALKEVGNIGMGNAATSLANIINKEVMINIPDLKLMPMENVPSNISVEPDSLVMIILMYIGGDIKGYILILFQTESAIDICQMAGKENDMDLMSENNMSLMDEIGCSLAEAHIKSLSDFLDINAFVSQPYECYDMAGATMDNVLIEMSCEAKQALVFDTKFTIEKNTASFNILTLLDPGSLELILNKIDKMIQ